MKLDTAYLGNQIQKARKERELTQQQLADQIGFSVSSIRHWENDQNMPGIHTILNLTYIFDVPLDYFIKGE